MSAKSTPNPDVEFSRTISMNDVSEKQPAHRVISAKPDERAALAERFDLISLSNLEAELTLNREMAGRMVRVEGTFSVEAEQKCIVTLEPVPASLKCTLQAFFTDEKPPTPLAGEYEIPADDNDAEYVKGGIIDLGELVAQHIALELDPYPRKEGARHALTDEDAAVIKAEAKSKTQRPFEVLKNLKNSE